MDRNSVLNVKFLTPRFLCHPKKVHHADLKSYKIKTL